jgi:hypothetical protein
VTAEGAINPIQPHTPEHTGRIEIGFDSNEARRKKSDLFLPPTRSLMFA